ncbi:hypothetical protein EYR40_005884 [Pleurotus pulmonarius]|nr:hypothetical protein EYR40_005884 [Pleurotus pulmonarius]
MYAFILAPTLTQHLQRRGSRAKDLLLEAPFEIQGTYQPWNRQRTFVTATVVVGKAGYMMTMDAPAQASTTPNHSARQGEQGTSPSEEQTTTSPITLGSDLVLMTANQDIRSQIEILQRTITLVFWYKPNTEPLRLQHPVPTFPLFQLSRFPSLTTDLGLTPTTYLDTYNRDTRQWDQHTISTVRVIDGHPRLLYRIRKTLLEALNDDECVGLKDEIENQLKQRSASALIQSPAAVQSSPMSPTSPTSDDNSEVKAKARSPTLKRAAPSSAPETTGPPTKFINTDGFRQQQPYPAYLSAPAQNGSTTSKSKAPAQEQSPPADTNNADSRPTTAYPPGNEQSQSPASPTSSPPQYYNNNVNRPGSTQYLYQSPAQYNAPTSPSNVSLPSYLVHPPAAAPLIPYHPHPPLKRWPNDYTVSELSSGFQAMEALVHQTPNGGAAMTQRMAFERVFGSRYVKSTVCRHRGVWRKAPQSLRDEFEAMGEDERACWGEFVRRVEGRPPGRINGPTLIPVHELPYQLGSQQTVNGSSPAGQASAHPPAAGSIPNGANRHQAEEEEDEDSDEGSNTQEPPIMNSLQFAVEHNSSNSTSHTPTTVLPVQNSTPIVISETPVN